MKLYTFNIENVGVKEVKAINLVEAYNKLEKLVESNLVNYNIIETTVEPFKYKYIITSVNEYVYSDWGYKLYYDKEFYSFKQLAEKDLIELVIDSSDIEHEAPDHFEMEYEINGVEYEEVEL